MVPALAAHRRHLVKELRLFQLGDIFRDWYHALRDVLRGQRLAIAGRRALADLGSQAIATLAVFGTFAYIACGPSRARSPSVP